MRQPITITLADKDYIIQPLTLGQVRSIDVARVTDATADAKGREGAAFDSFVEVLAVALQKDNPEMTADALMALPGIGFDEITAAYSAVLRLTGLIPAEVPPKGTAAASTGSTSTAG